GALPPIFCPPWTSSALLTLSSAPPWRAPCLADSVDRATVARCPRPFVHRGPLCAALTLARLPRPVHRGPLWTTLTLAPIASTAPRWRAPPDLLSTVDKAPSLADARAGLSDRATVARSPRPFFQPWTSSAPPDARATSPTGSPWTALDHAD